MGRNRIEEIKNDGHGNITILHSNGAFHYNEEDVVRKEWTNDFRCLLDFNSMSKGHVVGFVGIAAGIWIMLTFTLVKPSKDGTIIHITDGILFLIRSFVIFPLLGFFLTRCYYFLFYRDFFHKQILNIHLKSNKSGLFYHFIDDKKAIQKDIFYKRENSFYSNVEERIYSNVPKYLYLREILIGILLGRATDYICLLRDFNYENGPPGYMVGGIMLMTWFLALIIPPLTR
jgi:hypothetical protein